MSISDLKVPDTTGITDRFPEASIATPRLKRQRSFITRNHNGNALKKYKKTKNRENNRVHNDIPIFLQKTYDMISTCDPKLCEWTPNGDMFVVKDKAQFTVKAIPKYFGRIQFNSFVRQLTYYGFRKIQTQPVRKADVDEHEVGYMTFCNKNFKRDKTELMHKIQRSTRGNANISSPQEMQGQIEALKEDIVSYKGEVAKLADGITFLQNKCSHIEKICLTLAKKSGLHQPQYFQSTKYKVDSDQISSIDGEKNSLGVSGVHQKHPSIKMNIPFTPNKTAYDCRSSLAHNKIVPKAYHTKSMPTLPPHHITQSGILPSSLHLLPERVPSHDISIGRYLSNASDLSMDTFDKNLFSVIMLDENDIDQN